MTAGRVVVVGGGITGLTFAFTLVDDLARRGLPADVRVIESEPQVGGHARTIIEDGFLVESGPNGFLNREPEALDLVSRLGLNERVVEASPTARRRFIVRHGQLLEVPDSPASFLASPTLSWRAKLRVLREPWAPGPPGGVDETVFEFASRRLGQEAAETFVDTIVSGISGGDSRKLSLRSMFPALREWEATHGSLFKAGIARPKRPEGTKLISFDQGLGVLTTALGEELGESVTAGVRVSALERHDEGWRVALSNGELLTAEQVVLATPAHVSARLLQASASRVSSVFSSIPYVGLVVVAFAFPAQSVPRATSGYGYLVPRSEKLATLGVLWESSIFAGRAPAGHVLLRVVLGGAFDPGISDMDERDVAALARRELRAVMGVTAAPEKEWIFRWPRAIAQYTEGHDNRLRSISSALSESPGLTVCGTAYDGVSFVSAIASARRAARVVGASVRPS